MTQQRVHRAVSGSLVSGAVGSVEVISVGHNLLLRPQSGYCPIPRRLCALVTWENKLSSSARRSQLADC